MPLEELFKDDYVAIDVDEDAGVVRLKRLSTTPPPAGSTFDDIYGGGLAALDRIDRNRYTLLNDLRDAVGRQDEAFEQTAKVGRRKLHQGFARVGILVRTVVGKLNVQRHAREDGSVFTIFVEDEANALAWARDPKRSSPPGSR